MAEQSGLRAGDTITLISPEGDVTPMGVQPARQGLSRSSAIFEIGMSEYRFVDHLHAAGGGAALFQRRGLAQSIEVFVDHPDAVD